MHILLVANSTWNIVNFRMPVIDALLADGHLVTVLTPPDQYVAQLSNRRGLEFEALEALDRKSTDIWSNLRLWFELSRQYKRIAPDLILHFTIKPNLIGSLAAVWQKRRSVLVVTGLGYAFLHGGLTQNVTKFFYRLACKNAKEVVFENQEDLELFRSLKLLSKNKGRVVAGCGVDITYFSPRERTQNKKYIFSFIGRLLADKGIHEFVEAAALVHRKYPNTVFRIVGNLDENNPAHISPAKLAEWRRIPGIEYLGYLEDLRDVYAETDWVVLPSYREGLSRVLLEALSMARPVITTDTPGCREAVQPGKNGYLVPVRNTRALAISFETAINLSFQEWQTFCAFSRRKAVTEFESTIVGDFYAHLVKIVLSQARKVKSELNESS